MIFSVAKVFTRKITISCIIAISLLTMGTILLYKATANQFEGGKIRSNLIKKLILEGNGIRSCQETLSSSFWRNVNLQKDDVPTDMEQRASLLEVHSGFKDIGNTTIHYISSVPKASSSSRISVLLLHGQAFNSFTWKNLNTISLLAAFGYYTVAVDLPGFGSSPKASIVDKADFIDEIITSLNLTNPVIISPSMSGTYSMDFLIEHSSKLSGFVPISPVATKALQKNVCDKELNEGVIEEMDETCKQLLQYLKKKDFHLECLQVPTMIVFGEYDKGENSARLCHLPFSQAIEIHKGTHAAYLTDPQQWHKLLYNFLSMLSSTINCR